MSGESTGRDRFPVVVHVLLWRGGGSAAELFLLERAGTGFMDGYHVPPGGHQHAGEGIADAARRECMEETGVLPVTLVPVCVMPYRSGRHQGINFVFEGRSFAGEPGIGEPDRCVGAAWHALDALPQPLAPWLGDVLELRSRGDWFRELSWP
jgi:8-oxo-dGTP diphosphatase